mmetsp:Transcript_59344/g.94397  ORF Transcript_59344/g.94397 Transcript_59344/m.94397 type:complete len:428 (+) Transcript_59344:33-1316(+)|eukprot:CAMPEP_0197023678 /NCGR_PEP_ID=MMETSP1384-20130603/4341_1 /TAXON_ID=29189 /ORGANISM="Ammonia sp." /LENGTH=427 /DNA_ID=CAMNT_0042451929 /DNA_START=32 /DNA_END=1315 /DNA_ORIENTATION=+
MATETQEITELKRTNKELHSKIKALSNQIEELQSENTVKDEIIHSLEKDLESVLKLAPQTTKPEPAKHTQPSTTSTTANHHVAATSHHTEDSDTKREEHVHTASTASTKPKQRGIIGIIGAGQMGSQLCTLLSLKKYQIVMIDQTKVQLEKCKKIHRQICDSYLQQNVISKQELLECGKIVYAESIDDLRKHAQSMHTVIDTSHELYKKLVLQQVAKCISNECMILTHSNQKSITEIQSYLSKVAPNKRGNVIGINLLWFEFSLSATKCIEIIPSWNTAPRIVEKCKSLVTKDLARQCVVVADQAGFVSNRLMAVYVNEAFQILQSQSACNKDIDQIQTLVPGINGSLGPFALADKIGLDLIVQILEELYKEYGLQKYVPCSMLKQYVRAGKFGRKSGVGVYSYNNAKRNNAKANSSSAAASKPEQK